jgi:uncharacterized protein (DUF433 family)
MKRKRLGRFICADPNVCHGQLTFRGTRVLVSDVLELVASGMAWDKVIEESGGGISRPAIAEAIRFAGRVIAEHSAAHLEWPVSA